MRWCPDGDFWWLFCVLCFQRAACNSFQTCILNLRLRRLSNIFGVTVVTNLRCRSETCCTQLAENTGRKKVAKNRHLGTIALCRAISSQRRHVSTFGKNVKQQYDLHMSSQYDELRPTSGWDRLTSLGHPSKFQRPSRLGSVTARHLVVSVRQTLRRWTEGATYVRQGDHHVEHWPTFLVVLEFTSLCLVRYGVCSTGYNPQKGWNGIHVTCGKCSLFEFSAKSW